VERWRRSATVLAITEAENLYVPDDRIFGDVLIVLPQDDVDRMMQGYLCAHCLEPFEIPWPMECPVCHVAVREHQMEYLAAQYQPQVVDLRPPTYDEQMDAIREDLARKERDEHVDSQAG
jgi:hypothetical protein